jgi:serralysin
MSNNLIKACIDKIVPRELIAKAGEVAIAENPLNRVRTLPLIAEELAGANEMAIVTGKCWLPGRTLKVRFLDGVEMMQAKVMKYAQEWSKHANIKFELSSTPDAEIRISFLQTGSWSAHGTDAQLFWMFPENSPTMNFGWLNLASPDDEYRRIVLHEFGHALGCIHEHQHPAGDIKWDRDAVIKYYSSLNWSETAIEHNIFNRYSRDISQYSGFDPASIMLYPIAREHTLNGFEVGLNSELSAMDKSFIATVYPDNTKQ